MSNYYCVKTVDIKDNKLIIKFRCSMSKEFYEILELVKCLEDRVFIPGVNQWEASITKNNIASLKYHEFVFSDDIDMEIVECGDIENTISISKELLPGFFTFQREGVSFLEKVKGIGLVLDDMGLGKSAQSLGYIKIHPEIKKILIICPSSLKYNWKNEIDKWLNKEKIEIIKGRMLYDLDIRNRFFIINYDIIKDWEEVLKLMNFEIVVADEIQYTMNNKAKRTKSFIKICKSIKKKIFLSGTPIKNRPSEFFTALSLIDPVTFSNRWRYLNRFCNPKNNGFGWVFNGATNLKELFQKISKISIRRLKTDVLKELPDKIITMLPVDISNRDDYDFAEKEFSEWLWQKEEKIVKVEALSKIEKLKQLSAEGKLKTVVKWIENVLNKDIKLVIMCTHHKIIDFLKKKFDKIAVKLDGRDSSEQKDEVVKSFQNDENVKLFIGNIKAAGVGLTLTVASYLLFMEFAWNPADMKQAEDRIHRIGQENCCNIYYAVGKNTIDESLIELLDEKQKIVDAVLDGKETQEEDLLMNLFRKYKRS